jgi:hypothetical protein
VGESEVRKPVQYFYEYEVQNIYDEHDAYRFHGIELHKTLMCLCDDGTLWRFMNEKDKETWALVVMPGIPQTVLNCNTPRVTL